MTLCVLGLTIMARIQGSLKRSPTWTRLSPCGFGGVTAAAGCSSVRFAATVVSALSPWARDDPAPIGSGRAAAIGVGCDAYERALAAGSPSARPASGHGARLAVAAGSALAVVTAAAARRGAGAAVAGVVSAGPLARATRLAACAGRAGFDVAEATSKVPAAGVGLAATGTVSSASGLTTTATVLDAADAALTVS